MDWEAVGAISEIIAVAVVVVTLIYVAVQIRQNTASVRATGYQQWLSANLELNTAAADQSMSHLFAIANADSKNLSDESFVSFAMWNLGVMQMAQATNYLYKSGSLDRELWEAEMNRAAGILAFPGVRQWWEAGGKTQLTPSFVKELEGIQSNISYWNWDSQKGFFAGDQYVPPT